MLVFLFLVGACSCIPNQTHTDAPIYELPLFATAAEARKHIQVPLPDAASNIRYASYHEWVAAEVYLRFEAPVDVCLNQAAELLPKKSLSISANARANNLIPFPKSPQFKDLSWYDLGEVKNVVSATEGHISIFIDQDRGVFYYHYTD